MTLKKFKTVFKCNIVKVPASKTKTIQAETYEYAESIADEMVEGWVWNGEIACGYYMNVEGRLIKDKTSGKYYENMHQLQNAFIKEGREIRPKYGIKPSEWESEDFSGSLGDYKVKLGVLDEYELSLLEFRKGSGKQKALSKIIRALDRIDERLDKGEITIEFWRAKRDKLIEESRKEK